MGDCKKHRVLIAGNVGGFPKADYFRACSRDSGTGKRASQGEWYEIVSGERADMHADWYQQVTAKGYLKSLTLSESEHLGSAPEANTNTSVYSYSNTWKIRVFVMYSYSWSVQIRIYSYSYVFVDTKVSAKVFVFAQFGGLENPQTCLKPQNFQKNSKYYL